MDLTNNDWMLEMARTLLARELHKLPEDAKSALGKTQVDIVRHRDFIEISIDSGGDPEVEEVRAVLLDSLSAPISQVVSLFGCRANVEQMD